MATNTYPTTVLTDRRGHVFEFKDNEIREQMADLISKTETSIASATEALNAAEDAQTEATRATEYMDQVAESVAAAVETAQEAAEAAETAQQALEDIVVTDTNGVAGTAGADQPLQSVLDGATKPVSQYPATTAPLASTDLIIIEKADGTRSKMTYDQFIAAISNQVINKTFTSGALANYLVNDANATTAGQRALDAKMGNTLNAAISTLNSRLTTDDAWLCLSTTYSAQGIAYRKYNGIVFVGLSGSFTGLNLRDYTNICTLPSGYRPTKIIEFVLHAMGGTTEYFARVMTDGNIAIYNPATTEGTAYMGGSVSFPV